MPDSVSSQLAASVPLDWAAIAARVLHPSKLLAIEAMGWIDRPLSASELTKVFEGSPKMSALSHHLKSLAGLGVISLSEKRKVRGAWQKLYVLADEVRGGELASQPAATPTPSTRR